jgi:hypothetical protein
MGGLNENEPDWAFTPALKSVAALFRSTRNRFPVAFVLPVAAQVIDDLTP